MAKGQRRAISELLVVQFLVPKHDRAGDPYSKAIHRRLRQGLESRFGGWSSLGNEPLPGAWRNPQTGEIEYDESWRYEVGIPAGALAELDGFLADLAYSLDQRAIWRVAYEGAQGTVIQARRPRRRSGPRGTSG